MSGLTLIHDGITVQTSRIFDMNSTIVTELDGGPDATLVIDPGIAPDEIAAIADAASATPAGRATHVLFTHGDFDHILGWAEFPGAKLLAHRASEATDPTLLERLLKLVAETDAQHGIIRPRPFTPPPASALTAPTELALGHETALFFPAPGHTRDGLFTVLPLRRTLIAGDYLSDQEFPFIYHSFRAYRQTLQLARRLCERWSIERLVPGHGKVALQPSEIDYRITTDLAYLDALEEEVYGLLRASIPLEEALTQLTDIPFRGQPIPPELAGAHAANVEFLYQHPEELQ
jgi:glyoxylase-like metal-dependent hydrolase (beta-lactamase superfamily II)